LRTADVGAGGREGVELEGVAELERALGEGDRAPDGDDAVLQGGLPPLEYASAVDDEGCVVREAALPSRKFIL